MIGEAALVGLVGLVGLGGCGRPDVVEPSAPAPLPAHHAFTLDATPKQHRRMVPPEAFLRAYLQWFGGLAPLEVQRRAKVDGLFDTWKDYLAALGLPDYQVDTPRMTESNTIMLATLGRLAEALCVRAVEHDLVAHPPIDQRAIFAFDEPDGDLTLAAFTPRFDVLHRTFLSYPAALAPADRAARFYALFREVASHHAGGGALTPARTAWAAICTALVQHPETELY
ncbi:MAG: hypothetical protein NT062_13020 [Proteobacteria bacterium]|nr:hypothetical protein [Pseudomonadota bacterium]